jgi:FixJ family two-component response regulator
MDRTAYLQKHRERREEILALILAGELYRVIAQTYGISTARVAGLAKKHGMARRQREKKVE